MALLANGVRLPWISYGTYKVPGSQMHELLSVALRAGYRGIDTAEGYRNEEAIGEALQHILPQLGLTRRDIFITSKLSPRSQGSEQSRAAVRSSLQALKTDYIDLYLIHWPGAANTEPGGAANAAKRAESWRSLEQLYDEGCVKAIGVSNYSEHHLTELIETARVRPHVNQCEFHPCYQQRALRKVCDDGGVHFQAYSSLGTSARCGELLGQPAVTEVAHEVEASPAQVLLRWALQHGVSVIPKSCNHHHILDNNNIQFQLTDTQMERLNSVKQQPKMAWDPSTVR